MSLAFKIRNQFWGKLKLRAKLPQPKLSFLGTNEHEFYKLLIDSVTSESLRDQFSCVVDVGCRNWSYVAALADSFRFAELIGIELDGGRRYYNLHRRIDMANAFAAELLFSADPNKLGRLARAVHADFLDFEFDDYVGSNHDKNNTLFTFFFPFVSVNPCKKWGIPKQYSDFDTVISRATEQCGASNLLSAHQGEWEASIAQNVYEKHKLSVQHKVVNPPKYWPNPYEIHIFLSTNALKY